MSQNATVNVDIKLGVNKFHVDEGHPHIKKIGLINLLKDGIKGATAL